MTGIEFLKYLNIASLLFVILNLIVYSNIPSIVNILGAKNDCQYTNTYVKVNKDPFINDPIPGELCSWAYDMIDKIEILALGLYFLLNMLIVKKIIERIKTPKKEHLIIAIICGFAGIYYSKLDN
jgi:hypothetical protein